MYNWKDALGEYYIYSLTLFTLGILISFFSSWIEQTYSLNDVSYIKLLVSNIAVTAMGVIAMTILVVFVGFLSEGVRFIVAPVLSFFTMFILKMAFFSKFFQVGSFKSNWQIALVHPVLFCILPTIGIFYIYTLSKGWKN